MSFTPCANHDDVYDECLVCAIDSLMADLKKKSDLHEAVKSLCSQQIIEIESLITEISELKHDLTQATSAVDDLMAENDRLKEDKCPCCQRSKTNYVVIRKRAKKAEAQNKALCEALYLRKHKMVCPECSAGLYDARNHKETCKHYLTEQALKETS